jgi:hypothetical protein
MQNKANFGNDKMSASILITKDYEENGHSGHQKTNPIQTQYKPNLSQYKPNLSQFQSQTNPIPYRVKMNAFAPIRKHTILLIMLLVDFTTLQGCQFQKQNACGFS